ncbi:MAG: glutamate racemase [Bacteroidetes bacterium]|nr:glutamate racemase [Bacteroidota bacterium]
MQKNPIGVFDSGFGGLTVLKEFVKQMPKYDYLYFGDNARAPYGSRSFETVYHYTLECVKHLFNLNCNLVILACNTASAKALRTIQQKDLPIIAPDKRVLGVIRPTTEIIGNLSKTKHIGILGTSGTINSESYLVEIEKFFPEVKVYQEACPMWVPLIENNEINTPACDYFIERHINNLLAMSNKIDVIVLGCTHYPLIEAKIKKYLPKNITIIWQGPIVANALSNYLNRHPEIDSVCSKQNTQRFLTTDSALTFNNAAKLFFGSEIKAETIYF